MLKVNKKNTRRTSLSVIIVNFEHISHLFQLYLLLNLYMYLFAWRATNDWLFSIFTRSSSSSTPDALLPLTKSTCLMIIYFSTRQILWFIAIWGRRKTVFYSISCTGFTREFDQRVSSMRLIQKLDPRVWPTSLTHKNSPRVWITNLTPQNNPLEWPMRMTHETHSSHTI